MLGLSKHHREPWLVTPHSVHNCSVTGLLPQLPVTQSVRHLPSKPASSSGLLLLSTGPSTSSQPWPLNRTVQHSCRFWPLLLGQLPECCPHLLHVLVLGNPFSHCLRPPVRTSNLSQNLCSCFYKRLSETTN